MINQHVKKFLGFVLPALVVFSALPVYASIDGQLDFGDSNQEVTELQTFLALDSEIYPEGLVTGYFGPLTQQAVQRFQAEHDIVSSGTPSTTGYGRVGPLTMAKINELMGENGTGGPEPDVRAPHIMNRAVSTTSTTATVSWTTNEDAESRVLYSTVFPFVYATAPSASDSAFDEANSVTITGLQPDTTYFYVMESVDFYGNTMLTVPTETFRTKP